MRFFQCVRTEPHLSSLTKVKNSAIIFCQFVQICYGEKVKVDNGNYKAFCVTRKRNNINVFANIR